MEASQGRPPRQAAAGGIPGGPAPLGGHARPSCSSFISQASRMAKNNVKGLESEIIPHALENHQEHLVDKNYSNMKLPIKKKIIKPKKGNVTDTK